MIGGRRQRFLEEEGEMCIPGLGQNKPRPRELNGGLFGYVADAFAKRSPDLPSDSSQSPRSNISFEQRSESPASETAGDSSQMRDVLWRPPSPDSKPVEVEEELCVEVHVGSNTATPFFNDENGKFFIRGGKVVNDDSIEEMDVLIEDGVIVQVGKEYEVPNDAKIIDASDRYVMPGGIDTNVHFHSGADDMPLADDFASGTKAGLSGGTTMIIDLVRPGNGESLIEAYTAWKDDAEDNSCCDYAFKIAIPQWSESISSEMEELVKQYGVNAFKVFMSDSMMLRNNEILDFFEKCKELGAIAQIHAENGDIIAENEKRLLARGVTGPEGHPMARPEEIEEEAVLRACTMAKQVNVPLFISNPTGPAAAAIISKYANVIGEPSVASLIVDGSHYFNKCWSHAAAFVTNPPLRDDKSTPGAMINAVANGKLTIISSDNRTYNTDIKSTFGKDNFTTIPSGVNGVEDRMSLLWEKGVYSEKITMEQYVGVTSANAAKAFGIYPQKGKIAIGSDADIVIWNPNNLKSISRKTHAQAVDFNIFEGIKVHGAPEFVLQRGKVVVYEYQINASPGSGKLVDLPTFPSQLYDIVQDLENSSPSPVSREEESNDETDNNSTSNPEGFGVTTPRRNVTQEAPVMNKRLGVYQRPISAHGIRNQQDSTFSLTGGYSAFEDDQGNPKKSSVKVHAAPGGGSSGFW